MNQHDESSSTDIVNTPGEADEEDCRHMVNDLLLEVLQRREKWLLNREKQEAFIFYFVVCYFLFLANLIHSLCVGRCGRETK